MKSYSFKIFTFVKFFASIFLLIGSKLFATESITLQLKWQHQFQFAGYYAAKEKGYYKEAGLDVTIKEASQGQNIVQSVLSGSAEYGVGTSELILWRSKGAPVVVLGVVYQHSPLCFMAPKGGQVRSIHDLFGKKVMIEEGSAELFAYLKKEHIDKNKLQQLQHSFNPDDLINGMAEAMSVYSTDEPYYLASRKIPFTLYSPRESGIDFYGDNLFTSENETSAHPQRAKAFLAASMKGWVYAMSHKEEIVGLILQKYNTQNKTKEQLLYEAVQMESLIYTDVVKIGYMHEGRWQHIADAYKELGMMDKDIKLADFLYDENAHKEKTYKYIGVVLFLIALAACIAWVRHFIINQELKNRVKAEEEQNMVKDILLQEVAKRAEIGNMVANISHQWREPLSRIGSINLLTIAILGNNMALDRKAVEQNSIEMENIIRFMSETMQNFLEFYKPSTLSQEFGALKSIQKILTIVETKIKDHHIVVNLQGDESMTLYGIENEWMQVWLNVISNAVNIFVSRNTPSPTIDITVASDAISFCDNGGGGEIHEGSGLGHKMCREIVAKYGKTIEVEELALGICIKVALR
jgi:ABC-type nitrate/sulfonate/bicarbonate transport system substrate-binding protein